MILMAVAVHGALTAYAWTERGYAGFFPPFAQSNTRQIFSDLVIALSLVNVWVYHDLIRHGRSLRWFGAHLLATAIAGSFAPLIYLLVRDRLSASEASPVAAL